MTGRASGGGEPEGELRKSEIQLLARFKFDHPASRQRPRSLAKKQGKEQGKEQRKGGQCQKTKYFFLLLLNYSISSVSGKWAKFLGGKN